MRIVFWFFLCILSALGVWIFGYEHYKTRQVTEEKTIEVWEGNTLRMILENDFSYHPLFLKLYFYRNPEQQRGVFPGQFTIPIDARLPDIIDILWQFESAPTMTVKILEWWNIYDIDECLSEKTCISWENIDTITFSAPGEFIELATNVEKWQETYLFLAGKKSLEGFLYPDTYFLSASAGLEDIIHEQLKNYERKILPLFEDYSDEEVYNLLILASIVEKEERNSKEKAKVAGILKKRWESGWMIGADITACYAHKYTSEDCKKNLSRHIYDINEYNTRAMVGLPKTPINNPHIDSIRSVIETEDSEYWYYLHDTQTGQIYYGRNEAEHEQNKRKYLR